MYNMAIMAHIQKQITDLDEVIKKLQEFADSYSDGDEWMAGYSKGLLVGTLNMKDSLMQSQSFKGSI